MLITIRANLQENTNNPRLASDSEESDSEILEHDKKDDSGSSEVNSSDSYIETTTDSTVSTDQ